MTHRHRSHPPPRGAALLLALLLVALVAGLASAAYWQQWQAFETERSQRLRSQSRQLLDGALDWARLVLREDASGSRNDHLAEPWAIPVESLRLSDFLAAASPDSAQDPDAWGAELSGQITDEQGKINWRNLLAGARLAAQTHAALTRLFAALGLPEAELLRVEEQLSRSQDPQLAADQRPLRPQRLGQLQGLGLSGQSLARLAAYTTWLPEPTPLNLNTAPGPVLNASLNSDPGTVQALLKQRNTEPFDGLESLYNRFPALKDRADRDSHGTQSRYFTVNGRLRLDGMVSLQSALVVRNGQQVQVLWRSAQHTGEPRGATPP